MIVKFSLPVSLGGRFAYYVKGQVKEDASPGCRSVDENHKAIVLKIRYQKGNSLMAWYTMKQKIIISMKTINVVIKILIVIFLFKFANLNSTLISPWLCLKKSREPKKVIYYSRYLHKNLQGTWAVKINSSSLLTVNDANEANRSVI